MHRDHDLDLISALAEGTLPDPSPARELVASCEECAELYHAHVRVREAVEAETPPAMTDIERARLHSSVWEEVSRPAAPAPRSSSPWWYRLAPVAAVLVVVVGIGMGGWLGLGGDGAGDMAEDTRSVASDAAGDGDAPKELAPLSEAAPEATEAPADTMAPDTTAAATDEAHQQSDAEGADLASSELPTALEDFRRRAEEQGEPIPDRFECPPPEGAADPPVAVEEASVEGRPAWFAAFGGAEEVTPVVAYRQSDCEILLINR